MKVKYALVQAMKTQRGCRGTALLSFNLGARCEWVVNAKPRPLYPGKERIIPYPTAFSYGNGMVLHFYQQQESSTTKTVHKVINKGLKAYV